MLIRRYGSASGRHVALLGEWDPTSPVHEELFRSTVRSAARDDRLVLVVTFDPAPVSHLVGSRQRPPLDDVAARLHQQEQCGVHTRVTISLTEDEASHAGVEELLSALEPLVDVAALVLGARQTLGTQHRGDDAAVRAACARRSVELTRLDRLTQPTTTPDARAALVRGRLAHTVALVGRPLYWSRPSNGEVALPWPAGRYDALPLAEPSPTGAIGGRLAVDLRPGPQESSFAWPADDVPWLGFVSGPADRMADRSLDTVRATG